MPIIQPKRTRSILNLALAAIAATATLTPAQTPQTSEPAAAQHDVIRWTGKLTSKLTPTAEIQFSIYAEPTAGSDNAPALWTETQTVPIDQDGHYTVLLGATTPSGIPASLFSSSEPRYLEARLTNATEDAVPAPRTLFAAVPYAYKAIDADTLAGHPATDYLTLDDFQTSLKSAFEGAFPPALTNTTSAITGSGTANTLALWTGASTLGDSLITQSGTSVGIATTTPATTLDVNGPATIRGPLNLPAGAAATASSGANSNSLQFTASSYLSTTKAAVAQNFKFEAVPTGNGTANPSAKLELLFASGTASPTPTGLAFAPTGLITFVPGQTFPGTASGTITGVTAGTGLLGGGTSGNVTLNIDTTKIARLAATNTFTGTQAITSGDLALPATTSSTNGVLTLGGTPFLHGYSSGSHNLFAGGAGNFTTTGISETGVGFNALVQDTTGQQNTAAGTAALLANSTGSYNTAIGAGALSNNKTGSNLTAIGYSAGPDPASTALTNATAIGAGANISQSNSLALGANTVGSPGKTNVNVGIGTATPISALEISQLAPGAIGPVLTLSNMAGNGSTAASAAIDFHTADDFAAPTSQIIATYDPKWEGDDISFIGVGTQQVNDFYAAIEYQTNVFISSNGAVGIGTNSPGTGYQLEVLGAGWLQGETAGPDAITGTAGGWGWVPYTDNRGQPGSPNPYQGGLGGLFTGGQSMDHAGGDGGGFIGGTGWVSQVLDNPPDPTAVGGDGLYSEAGTAMIYCAYEPCGGTSMSGNAATLIGDVISSGSVKAPTSTLRIDDPSDPANKYLVHASVESAEMMNIYTGNVVTDEFGLATIPLPDWFETLNTDFRYQLTVIGQFAQAIVKDEIANHKFTIMTNQTHVKVSWQVTAIRQDPYAKAHPLIVQQDKPANERGFYQNPELYGQPKEKQTEWGRHPSQMARMKAHQEAAMKRTQLPAALPPGSIRNPTPKPATPKQVAQTTQPSLK